MRTVLLAIWATSSVVYCKPSISGYYKKAGTHVDDFVTNEVSSSQRIVYVAAKTELWALEVGAYSYVRPYDVFTEVDKVVAAVDAVAWDPARKTLYAISPAGITVYDMSMDPKTFNQIGFLTSTKTCTTLLFHDGHLYATCGDLVQYDVKNPSTPVFMNSFTFGSDTTFSAVLNVNNLYVTWNTNSACVVRRHDLTAPSAVTVASQTSTLSQTCSGVDYGGGYLFVFVGLTSLCSSLSSLLFKLRTWGWSRLVVSHTLLWYYVRCRRVGC